MTRSSRSTPRPRRVLAAGAAAFLVVLTACGGGDEEDPAPTEADLHGALVAADDVPEGYTEADVEDDGEEDDELFAGTCFADIADFEDRTGDPDVEARSRFVRDENPLPVEISSSVSYYDDAATLADAWQDFVANLSACTQGSATTDDGTTVDLTLEVDDAVTLEGADDQADVLMRGTITAQGQAFSLNLHAITVRRENYVSVVGLTSFGSEPDVNVGELAAGQFERVRGLTD